MLLGMGRSWLVLRRWDNEHLIGWVCLLLVEHQVGLEMGLRLNISYRTVRRVDRGGGRTTHGDSNPLEKR